MSDSEESMELDSLVVEKCLRCSGDGSSMKLLVCSVVGCPIALHEECMCCKPEIDEKGNFYCPYCAHKRALVRAEKLRRKALGAKEVLSRFIRSGEVGFAVNDEGPVRIEEAGERENDAMEVEENEDKEMDEDVRKGDLEEQCVSERNEGNAGGGEDRGDEEDGGRSPGGEEMRPEAVEVPESSDFQRGSPVLRKRRYKKRAQKTVQIHRAIPLRMLSSCQTDVVEEDAEKQSEEDTISSSSESGKGSESDENGTGTASSKSSDIPDLNQNEKVTTSCFELRKIPEANRNEKTTASSKSSDIPDLNQNEKVTTSCFEFKKIPEANRNEKTTGSSKSSDIPDLNQNEEVTTSCFEFKKIPEANRNEKTTASLSSESREKLDPSQKEKATAVLPKSRKVPDSNQNEKSASSTEPINVPKSGSDELFFHNFKRRKVNWTDDELNMIKEGVRHYSDKVNKNIPWRKILDRGRHVFHETRTSTNLKDKWQAMCKEATNKNQT